MTDWETTKRRLQTLGYPIGCWAVDADGDAILVDLVQYLGTGKWLAYDEDGKELVVDWKLVTPLGDWMDDDIEWDA